MNCYVVCENVYRDDTLQSVNIIGVGENIEDANALIEFNREELKRLFNGKFDADFYDDDGSHEFRSTCGVVYRTCACKTEYRKMAAKKGEVRDASREYTAQEMREQAKMHDASAKEVLKDCENEGGSTHRQLHPSYAEDEAKTAAMLVQAAEMRERAEKRIEELSKCSFKSVGFVCPASHGGNMDGCLDESCSRGSVICELNKLLRGDAGKE